MHIVGLYVGDEYFCFRPSIYQLHLSFQLSFYIHVPSTHVDVTSVIMWSRANRGGLRLARALRHF